MKTIKNEKKNDELNKLNKRIHDVDWLYLIALFH